MTKQEKDLFLKQICTTIIERIQMLEQFRNKAKDTAKAMLKGAAKTARLLGHEEEAVAIDDTYGVLIERNVNIIYKVAGVSQPKEPKETKQAA